ncbi:MAG TPA: ABC transporter permease [Phycisphaerae bacterium]|nr:ABC transporter permease [Phycisphaerae bacterium]
MGKVLSIAHNTFLQTIRQPIFIVLVLVTAALLVLSLPMAGWTMGESGGDYHETDQKMLVNLGLSTLLMLSLLVSAFSASGALAREIEDRTALTVISKPVSRALFVLGKFLGVAAAVSVWYYICTLVLLMTVRHQVMPSASDPYDWPVIVLGCSAVAVGLVMALGGNFFFGLPFTSAGVWSLLVCLSVGMGLITFVGKDWKVVPPGYDVPPQPQANVVKVELERGYSDESFKKRLTEVGCTIEKTQGRINHVSFSGAPLASMAAEAGVAYDRDDRLTTAIRIFRSYKGVRTASTVVDPPVIGSDLLAAVTLIFMGVMVLVAMAIVASTRLGQAMTLLVCFGAFMVGSVHPFLGNFSQYVAVRLLGWAAPNLTYFYSMDALSRPIATTIPFSFVALAGAYCGLYLAGLLAVGIALFQRRQMDATAASSTMPGAVNLLAGLGRAAALVIGFAGLVVLSVRQFHTPVGLLIAAGLLAAAVAKWLLWGCFGRGVRWSYWVVGAAAAAGLLRAAIGLALPDVWRWGLRGTNPVLVVIQGLGALFVLAVLLLPKTRRHFRSRGLGQALGA